jgi:CheY-like chemotaxis protein
MSSPYAVIDSPRAEALTNQKVWRRNVTAGSDDPPRHPNVAGQLRHSGQPARSSVPHVLAGVTVMVVDDDPDSLDYFGMALRAAGAVVIVASNALDALRTVQERRPNVVLSDIAMSGHDGYWLLHEIRRVPDEAIGRLPVIATTAYGREHSRERTLAAGFIDHLQKPVLPEALWRSIATAVGRPTV